MMTRRTILKPVRMGVIGLGLWGQAHARIISSHPFAELVAVCDLEESRASAVGESYRVPYFTDFRALLADKTINAVSIVTPDFAHTEFAIAAAEAGKHVLVEKPLATKTKECEQIIGAMEKNKVRIMVDFHNRWNPPFAHAKESIEAGQLGDIVSAYFRLTDVISVPTSMLSWSAKSSILWFLGSHTVDTLRWLLKDEVKRVFAVSRSGILKARGIDVADIYQAILEFRKGTIASIENNWIVPNTQPFVNDFKFNILGSKGMISVDMSNNQAYERFLEDRADHPDIFVKPVIHGKPMGFAHESIRSFIDCIASEEPFVVDAYDGLEVTRVLEAIMRSAETKEPVLV
jgi:predicted dehydrogenase